ncbi:MAG: hypothetical protein ACO1PW_06405, partial [Actinomycetota bacterium]
DQWGYLGSARYLAGDPHPYVMPEFPYFTYGYSIVLAPLARAIRDPQQLFLAIKVVNAVLVSAVLPLLYVFCRTVLATGPRVALAAAGLGSLVPPLIAHPAMILAENLVLPLVVATLLAAWLLLEDRPAWQRLLLGPAVAWLHVTHNRFAAALLVVLAFLVVVAVSGAVPRRLAAANAALLVVLLGFAQVLRDRIVAARWIHGIETPQGPASDALEVLQDRHLFGEYLLVSIGQLWYLAVGTLGVGLVGIGVALWRAGGRPRPRGERLVPRPRDPERLVLLLALGMAAAVFATSAYFFTRVVNGSEGFVAGRHNDSFVPVWVAIGASFLLAPPTRAARRGALALALVVVVLLTAALLGGRGSAALDQAYSALNVPALVPHGHSGVRVVVRAAGLAVVALLAAFLLSAGRRSRPAWLLALVGAWFVVGVGGVVRPEAALEGWDVPARLAQLDLDRAAVVLEGFERMPVHYPFYLPGTDLVPWDGRGRPPADVAIAGFDRHLGDQGARIALVDSVAVPFGGRYAIAVWVMPGPTQDRLAAAGLLEPAVPTGPAP